MTTLVPPTEQRSRNMSAIRSKDTGIELKVRRAAHSQGFRFRVNRKDLPGKPDLVFPRFRLITFVHGCYWHGHICKEARRPKSNLQYWTPKIEGNMARDARVREALENAGWDVFIIRECTVIEDIEALLNVLKEKKAKAE